ncbi:cytochrome P450 [Halenospora varia]|nr:cytochrome P450 [Halenospora varia]
MSTRDFMSIMLGAISVYAATRCIYLLYFHPLSKLPGPKIAAVSNVWYGYHWLSGRYPWAIENALKRYGGVVRIAPNELVFITPQASIDIYASHRNHLEVFPKTDFNNRGKDMGGIIWEEDPVKHREVARKIAPAFSNRSIRAMEPEVHRYIDSFVSQMRDLGGVKESVGLVEWTNWLAMDLSADLTWDERMGEMRDLKNTIHLDVLLGFNKFSTILQVAKRFPLLSPLKYLFVPFSKLGSFAAMEQGTRQEVARRIERRGKTSHVDFFEYILPSTSPVPKSPHELLHLGSIAVQVMFAGFGPMSDWFFGTLYYLLQEPECYRILVEEVRSGFESYEDITTGKLREMEYLNACLEESLRLLPSNNTGLPRLSPGKMVDGSYIPKGTHIQTSIFALSRSPKYLHEPLNFHPERFLRPSHPLYSPAFASDNLKGLFPFSLGPRLCIGKEMAWLQGRLFLGKVLWSFDVVEVEERVDLDGKLRHFGFFQKPEVRARFVPVF